MGSSRSAAAHGAQPPASREGGSEEEVSSSRSLGTQQVAARAVHPCLGVASAFFYGSVAVGMNFLNKYTMQIFPLPSTVMVLQMLTTWAVVHVLLVMGFLDFEYFSWKKCRQLFFMSFLYTCNSTFALAGIMMLNVPMYNTLKRLTPIFVLLVKAIAYKKAPAPQITASVCLVVVGCIIAGIGDLTFDLYGYLFAFLSCVTQAGYLLLVEYQGADGISTPELLYYNAILSLPLLAVVVFATGEGASLAPRYFNGILEIGLGWFWFVVGSCSIMGCVLNYALFLCANNNSALTTTIVGVVKSVFAVVLGFFLLDAPPFSLCNVIGIALNLVGGTWYSLYKFTDKQRRKAMIASPSLDAVVGLPAPEADAQAESSKKGAGHDVEGQPLLLTPRQPAVEPPLEASLALKLGVDGGGPRSPDGTCVIKVERAFSPKS